MSQRKTRHRIQQMATPIRRLFKTNKQLSYYLRRRTKRQAYSVFGFVSNPDLPPWLNTSSYLKNIPPLKCFNRTASDSYHNLCTLLQPPVNCDELLGLGLNFVFKIVAQTLCHYRRGWKNSPDMLS